MRRWRVLVRATLIEILDEPLVLLTLLAALALSSLAPAFHYHQFGEPTRMARDAGVSAILLGGAVVAVAGAVKTFRREIETQTAQTALALSVSPALFFLAKTFGCMAALVLFFVTVGCVSLTVVTGAAIGGRVADAEIVRLWGPSLALALSAIVLSLVVGAALNRFRRARFTLTANVTALVVALAGVAYRFEPALALKYGAVAVLAMVPAFVLLASAASFSTRLRGGGAIAATAFVALLFLPALGNYCVSDALTNGGSVGLGYFAAALLAAVPAVAALLALGVVLFSSREQV